jgi:orotidine-5'-phosphate decarboxylase
MMNETDVRRSILIPLDFADADTAAAMATQLAGRVGGFKVGLELFNVAGPAIFERLRPLGGQLFYDCKLHDIPNTVAGASRAIGRMGVKMFNVHALGGREMMRAAREAVDDRGDKRPLVLGVTILTSINEEMLRGLGVERSLSEEVIHLARETQAAGLDGVVASPHEVAAIKQACGASFVVVTPGIRPAGSGVQDQKRVATPAQALAAGADYLVIGRAVTQSDHPAAAVDDIVKEVVG